jgi:hypothetical protein
MMVEDTNRVTEIAVELAWMADPVTCPYRLAARVNGSSLEVRGYVPSAVIHERVMKHARQHCALPVVDNLKVHPSMSFPTATVPKEQMQKRLEEVVKTSFPGLASRLRVQCRPSGQVYVSGPVPTHEEKLAVSHKLRRLPGCCSVVNLAQVDSVVAPGASQHAMAMATGKPATGGWGSAGSPYHPMQVGPAMSKPVETVVHGAPAQPVQPIRHTSGPKDPRPASELRALPGRAEPALPLPPAPSAGKLPELPNLPDLPSPVLPRKEGQEATAAKQTSLPMPSAPVKPAAPGKDEPGKVAPSAGQVGPLPASLPLPSAPAGKAKPQLPVIEKPVSAPAREPYVTSGVMIVSEDEEQASPPARPAAPSALELRLRQAVKNACGKAATDVEVVVQSASHVVVRLKAPSQAEADLMASRILAMPELGGFDKKLEIKVPSPVRK